MKFDLVNLTKIETQNNLHQRSLMWCIQNDLNNQGFLFGNLEMQHTTELGVDESETMLHGNKYWKKSCYCNMQISSSYRFWDMEGPWSSCHSGYGKCIFFGHILVSARFEDHQLACIIWEPLQIVQYTCHKFQFAPNFLFQLLTRAWFVSTLNILLQERLK